MNGERRLARITAHLLAQSMPMGKLGAALLVLALGGLLWSALSESASINGMSLVMIWLSAASGLVSQWLALRCRFDAALFADLAEASDVGAQIASMDRALFEAGLIRTVYDRSLTDRVRGACRLLRSQMFFLLIQTGCLLISGGIRVWMT